MWHLRTPTHRLHRESRSRFSSWLLTPIDQRNYCALDIALRSCRSCDECGSTHRHTPCRHMCAVRDRISEATDNVLIATILGCRGRDRLNQLTGFSCSNNTAQVVTPGLHIANTVGVLDGLECSGWVLGLPRDFRSACEQSSGQQKEKPQSFHVTSSSSKARTRVAGRTDFRHWQCGA